MLQVGGCPARPSTPALGCIFARRLPHTTAAQGAPVLCVDVDTFFAQVEIRRRGLAFGVEARPIAVQQHQDIIAVNAQVPCCCMLPSPTLMLCYGHWQCACPQAKAAGVVKHMQPAAARRVLREHAAAGGAAGEILHVFLCMCCVTRA